MAIIQYEILGKVIDMTAVAKAIEEGNLLGTLSAIEAALGPIIGENKCAITTLGRRIMNTGSLPTEKEIEETILGGTSVITPDNSVHSTFPIPTKTVPKCPTCGSTDLVKKGVGARAIDGFVFGRLSVEGRSQFRCRNCSYEW